MASKRSPSKTSTARPSPAKGKRKAQPKSAAAARKPVQRGPLVSPQMQRELFAFALIGLGMLLLVLFASADPGVVGGGLVDLIQRSFGAGQAVVPIALIVVGGLLFWQERFVDAPVSLRNVLGVVVLLLVLLGATEFASTRQIFGTDLDAPTSIGGAIDLGLMMAFGVGGVALLLLLAFVLGMVLTFNVTLGQIVGRLSRGFAALLEPLRREQYEEVAPDEQPEPVPFSQELKRRAPRPALKAPAPPAAPQQRTAAEAATAPPSRPGEATALPDRPEQPFLTPIAARPTQASLFNRPDSPATGATVRIEKAPAASEAAGEKAKAAAAAPKATVTPGETQAVAAERKADAPAEEVAAIDTSAPRRAWSLPSLRELEDFSVGEIDDNEKRNKARIIEHTLASFKIEAQVVGMNPGPAVTQYQLQPAVGVKVSRITSLQRDLELALAAPAIRIEAPIPGTPYIGVEIPNSAIASVSMKEVIDTDEFARHSGKLKLALGKDVSGAPVVADLTRAPHLLIAGSTGSGKSKAINSILCTLLMQHTPDELKFIMVDPKMVELIVYNHIPHLLAPVVTELERVVSLLKWAVREMERRYKLLAQKGYRNIESYNKAACSGAVGLEPLPYIVIIVDELADLMMLAPDEVETLVCRLAQMARAIGIHLILATQRPSVDVVTGLIKANFPTRMAFAVTSQIDSRVILDQSGAEKLLGRGDMLYLASDAPKPVRVQGTNVSDKEVENVARFWRAAGAEHGAPAAGAASKPLPLKQREGAAPGDPDTAGVSPLPDSHTGALSDEEEDELLPKAMQLVRQHERASASLLQRRLRIGYSKAAQLIDLLEQRGVVGPAEEGRSREVLKPGHGHE